MSEKEVALGSIAPLTGIRRRAEGDKADLNLSLRPREASERTYEIAVFHPKDWSRQLKRDIMAFERLCYPRGIRMDAKYKKETLMREGEIVLLAYDKETGRVIGEAFGGPLNNEKDELGEDDEEPEAFKEMFLIYGCVAEATFYMSALSVHPDYQKRGVGTELMRQLLARVKQGPYNLLVGHGNGEVALSKVYERFGAKAVRAYRNWFNTGSTYWLYEIHLADCEYR